MKKLYFFLLFFFPSQCFAWTLISSNNCGLTGGAAGFSNACSLNSTGADLLVVSADGFSVAAITVTDSKSNTWNCNLTTRAGSSSNHYICYAWFNAGALAVGTSHTISLSCSSCFPGATFSAWSGSRKTSDPLDSTNFGGNTIPSTTGQPGNITPTANDLFVTSGGPDDGTPFDAATVNSSFIKAAQQVYSSGTNEQSQVWYLTSASAQNPTWTFSSSAYDLLMAAFIPDPASVSSSQNRGLLIQ